MFSIKKKLALAAVLMAAVMAEAGCGVDTESSSVAPAQPAATEADAETPQEETTEEETEAEAETETEEETEPEAETEEETEEEVTEEATEEEAEPEEQEAVGGIPTNGELLAMINSAFGIMTDNTVEGNIQAAKDWDIIDENAVIDADAEITAEFLISASMRATGFVTGSSTMTEILECALQSGVIEDTELSASKLSQAADIVEKAKYAWVHQEFDNEIHVELCDGVIDLTNMTGEYSINGNVIVLPSEYAENIDAGTVFILPKDETGQGGAYKADLITDNGDGSITIQGNPAEFLEVYKKITTN